ncbi:DUF4363 family protein [Lysinibacillus endophyticus]|uniref:DUF4363 family protein n=1 Tax=Ureibacillus endophyticus TaxID=1978490 RepID=UPI00313551BA
MKNWILLSSLLILLSGCSNINGENEFYEKVNSIEDALKDPDWKQLNLLGAKLEKLYRHNLWKIQLMGDEDEYESLQESINQLIAAIEEQDMTEIKLEIATIKTYLEDIYSL